MPGIIEEIGVFGGTGGEPWRPPSDYLHTALPGLNFQMIADLTGQALVLQPPILCDRAMLSKVVDRALSQLVQQHLCGLQVLRVEAFGEPVVDGREKFAGLVRAPLPAEELAKADRGA